MDPDASLPAKKVDEWSQELKDKWNAMSQKEKVAATKDAVEKLKERREMKKYAKHNVPIAALHDVNSIHVQINTLVCVIVTFRRIDTLIN